MTSNGPVFPDANVVIAEVEELRPNTISEEQKKTWLEEVDAKLYNAVVRRHLGVPGTPYRRSTEVADQLPADPEPMLVPFPFGGDIYRYYLFAMIDMTNGDTARYNNDMIMYNSAVQDWSRAVHRDFLPVPNKPFRI